MLKKDNVKEDAINAVHTLAKILGLTIIDEDTDKPWGAYFVIDPKQTESFITKFFPEEPMLQNEREDLYPKFLLIQPSEQISWQYHQRREEIWKVVNGPVGIVLNETDELITMQTIEKGTLVTVLQEVRHRIVGLENWGLIAEIWRHTDLNEPSNEEDIVRLEDDYGRE